MKILITNDDGLYSSGIRASYEALKDLGEVYVVAPATQMSGVGRSISIMEPVRVSEVSLDGMKGYAVDGTPVDSVVIGIYEIIGDLPDIVVSGINMGENISTEAVTTSGTVCAALEAATQGCRAIAISQQVKEFEKFEFVYKPCDFTLAKLVLRKLVEKVLKEGFPENVDVLNVNVPAVNLTGSNLGLDLGLKSESKSGLGLGFGLGLKSKSGSGSDSSSLGSSSPLYEVAVTKLARRMYRTKIEKRIDPRGRTYYWIDGVEVEDAEEGTDLHAIRSGKVSVTPLSLDMTSYKAMDVVSEWLKGL